MLRCGGRDDGKDQCKEERDVSVVADQRHVQWGVKSGKDVTKGGARTRGQADWKNVWRLSAALGWSSEVDVGGSRREGRWRHGEKEEADGNIERMFGKGGRRTEKGTGRACTLAHPRNAPPRIFFAGGTTQRRQSVNLA